MDLKGAIQMLTEDTARAVQETALSLGVDICEANTAECVRRIGDVARTERERRERAEGRVEELEARPSAENALARWLGEANARISTLEAEAGALREALENAGHALENVWAISDEALVQSVAQSGIDAAKRALASSAGAAVAAEIEAGRALYAALPECDDYFCSAKATKRSPLGTFCDDGAPAETPDLPYAAEARALEAARAKRGGA